MSDQPAPLALATLTHKELELKTMIQRTIAKAKQLGADEVFISASYGVQSKIAFEKGDYNLATRHEGEGLTITVHKNKSCGCASINALDPQLIEDAIDKALHLAKHSVPDEFISLAPKAEYVNLDLPKDPALAELSMEALVQLTQGFVSECLRSEKISIDSASVEQSSGVRVIANSNGMLAHEQHNGLTWSVMGMAIDQDDITSFDYLGDHSLTLEGCELKMKNSATKFRHKLLQSLGAQNGRSYCGKVLLSPALVEELLLDPLLYHIMGGNIMDGKSRWADAIGTTITSESITLEDHPHNPAMRGCTTFSGDGIPTQKMTVIKNGKLLTHLDSVYSAKRRGTTPTGNGGGLHVPVMKSGELSKDELISQSEGFLLYPSRFSGNIDSLNGDFSGVAKGSLLYENGQLMGPVKEVMISGNVFDILKSKLHISQDTEDDGGYYQLPHVLIDDISVTAD